MTNQPQPHFVAEYAESRSRLTTFFRWLLAIPHLIVLMVWGFVAGLAIIVAWFAVVITARYPAGLYGFVGSFLRYATAVYGYLFLLTDRYPPFGAETDDFPVHLVLPPPLERYSRLKALFRLILAIPVFIISYAMQIVFEVGALIAWFAIIILGRQPKGLQDMIVLGLSYQQRAYAYITLLTEDWPPFTDEQEPSALGDGGGPQDWLPPAPTSSPSTSTPPPTSSQPGLSSGDPLGG